MWKRKWLLPNIYEPCPSAVKENTFTTSNSDTEFRMRGKIQIYKIKTAKNEESPPDNHLVVLWIKQ